MNWKKCFDPRTTDFECRPMIEYENKKIVHII